MSVYVLLFTCQKGIEHKDSATAKTAQRILRVSICGALWIMTFPKSTRRGHSNGAAFRDSGGWPRTAPRIPPI